MTMFTFSLMLQQWEWTRVLNLDSYLVFFSLSFVYLWLFVHTQSFFIASVGISQIFLSIPAAILPYALFLQVKYLGLMQFLTVFVVLGVGADDVFVLVDSWKQSKSAVPTHHHLKGDNDDDKDDKQQQAAMYAKRLKYALVRTAQAVSRSSSGVSECVPPQ